jgi:hypothetical protein
MRVYWRASLLIVAVAVSLATTASTGLAQSPPRGLRYCDRPGGPGNFVAASPSVSCRTARRVSNQMASDACVNRTTCSSGSFYCISRQPGTSGPRVPFSVSHHGKCSDGHRRRIEFDWG